MRFYKKPTFKLKKEEIKQIAEIKDSFWKFGYSSQLRWFENLQNVFKDDLHFFLKKNKKIIGYVQIGKRKYKLNSNFKNYYLFRTLIISKKERNKKMADKIMNEVSKFIIKKKKPCFLLCKKNLVKFYLQYDWSKISKKNFKIEDHKSSLIGMIYNQKKNEFTKIKKFFYNK